MDFAFEYDEQLFDKASKFRTKKSKFSSARDRTGATLRRVLQNRNRGDRRHEHTVVKSLSSVRGNSADEINRYCKNVSLEDGNLTALRSLYGLDSSRRWNRTDHGLEYSLNKKQRWLLPEMLQKQMQDMKEDVDNPLEVVVIKRSVAPGYAPNDVYSNVTQVSSTLLQTGSSVTRKSKPRKYARGRDLLSNIKSNRKKSDETLDMIADDRPRLTYEINSPRPIEEYCNYAQLKYYRYNETTPAIRIHKKIRMRSAMQYDNDISMGRFSERDLTVDKKTENVDRHRCLEDFLVKLGNDNSGSQSHEHSRTKRRTKQQAVSFTGNQDFETTRRSVIYKTREPTEEEILKQKNEQLVINERNKQAMENAKNSLSLLKSKEDKHKTQVEISSRSLQCLENMLKGNKTVDIGVPIKFQKSNSFPAIFLFEFLNKSQHLETQIAIKTRFRKSECGNWEFCLTNNSWCSCGSSTRVCVKTKISSREECNQHLSHEWNKRLQATLCQWSSESAGKVLELSTLLQLANFSLEESLLENNDNSAAIDMTSKLSNHTNSGTLSIYKRAVIERSAELAGFKCENVPRSKVISQVREIIPCETESDEYVMVNEAMVDFCGICYAELSTNREFRAMALSKCNHWFCMDCWLQYLVYSVHRPVVDELTCPANGCSCLVCDVTLMALLSDGVMAMYRRRLEDKCISQSRSHYRCPECSNVVLVKLSATKYVESVACIPLSCSCGARWCSDCLKEPHWPANCNAAKVYWEELLRQKFSHSLNLIVTISGKRCPACQEPIEKDGGCQMVTCVCGWVFCWRCLSSKTQCRSLCTTGEAMQIQHFDLGDNAKTIEEATKQAALQRESYTVKKTWLARMKNCFQQTEANVSDSDKRRKMLLTCDAIRHISQYLGIAVANSHQFSKQTRRKLSKMHYRLQTLLEILERSILTKTTFAKNENDRSSYDIALTSVSVCLKSIIASVLKPSKLVTK